MRYVLYQIVDIFLLYNIYIFQFHFVGLIIVSLIASELKTLLYERFF